MEDKKHIDRLFQEKLKDFEVFPDTEVWKNIEQQLVKKKKRRVFPLWLRFGSAAAVLLLISSSIFFNNTTKSTSTIPETNSIITNVDTDDDDKKVLKENNTFIKEDTQFINGTHEKEQEKEVRTPNSKGTLVIKNTTRFASTNAKEEISIKQGGYNTNQMYSDDNTAEAQKVGTTEKKSAASIAPFNDIATTIAETTKNKKDFNLEEKKDISEILKEEETIALIEKKAQKNKWSVGPTVTPIYYNTLGEGSPINSTLAQNEKNSITSASYGVKINYRINNRLSMQSGINALDLAYQTENVTALITSTSGLTNGTNIKTNIQGIDIVAISNTASTFAQDNEFSSLSQANSVNNLNGNLNQSFSYIEVPVEAKYNILQRKVGVNLVGGLSTYVLYNKGIALQNENGSTILGEASNVNDMNFSGNIGLDLDYNISKTIYLNISPMFKYQFNTFSENDGGFQPYYLGIYTGLNYRF